MPRSAPVSIAPDGPSLTAAPGRHWVFGYGSLAHPEHLAGFLTRHRLQLGAHAHAELAGFRRTWTVAMDNSQTLTGYKYYLDATTGARPDIFVAFANIERHPQARVSGLLFEACAETLALLDTRERNYERTDVTAHVSAVVEGTVWTYLGNAEATARYAHALKKNALVIDTAYEERIETAYAHAGLPYEAALPPHIRRMALTRVDT